jgi:microcystin-dependent protein
MSDPYIGEIRLFAGNFAPQGWAMCDGSVLPISQYEPLYNLIGTTYGGDGQSTFALPDLRGRLPVHQGNGYVMGQQFGVEEVTLTTQQIPSHSHAAAAVGTASSPSPANAIWATAPVSQYSTVAPTTALNAQVISATGGSQPHDNLQPYVGLVFIISLFGIFPSQN